ncbi:unnamed protein product [Polarella glacialis]|uniref:Uncharacterized protein n=1 Tax=Polarella glacialis TaxID=89957 RepID=A0A813DSR0_POLGL|nr:unnamed protein product [Polarella glacialis]
MDRCTLAYSFAETAHEPPMPAAVKLQRRQLGWTCKDQEVCCFTATCSIPALNLHEEEVTVSADPADLEGARRMLLLSLQRPDLGITLLRLEPGGKRLVGGDESWAPGQAPIILATRSEVNPNPPRPAPARPVVPQGVRRPIPAPKGRVRLPGGGAEPDAEPVGEIAASPGPQPSPPLTTAATTSTATPAAATTTTTRTTAARAGAAAGPEPDAEPAAEELRGFGVLGFASGEMQETADVESRMPLDSAGPPRRGAVPGGIGRSSGGGGYEEKPAGKARSGEYLLRPDLAAGKLASDVQAPLGPNALDAEIKAVAAANTESLLAASASGEAVDVKLLLARAGASVDSIGPPSSKFEGLSPLMAAGQKGRTEVVSLLLERRASTEVRDPSGWTALMHAVHSQRPDVAKLLLDAKADAQAVAEGEGTTALILAAGGARSELCQLLCAAGGKERADSEGCRALHHAARKGRGGAIVALLEAKAKIDATDKQGHTPFLAAVAAGRAECVRLLLSQGADAKAVDLEGRSAQKLATAYDHDRVLQVLKERSIK